MLAIEPVEGGSFAFDDISLLTMEGASVHVSSPTTKGWVPEILVRLMHLSADEHSLGLKNATEAGRPDIAQMCAKPQDRAGCYTWVTHTEPRN